jgi:hypothetical protein
VTQGERKKRLRMLLDRWYNESPLATQWINCSPVKVYVRKIPIRIGANSFKGFTVANITVTENNRNRGYFKEIIDWAKARRDIEAIKVENAITPEMIAIMEKWGWWRDNQDPPSFFWSNRA